MNVRTNDAWGLRDIVRTGSLFTAKFESYMAKVRKPEYRVFPPLPDDSPNREAYLVNGMYAPDNAVYELRPMPPSRNAKPDKLLEHDISGYTMKNWPKVREETDIGKLFKWWEGDLLIKSIAVNFRYDKYAGFSVPYLF